MLIHEEKERINSTLESGIASYAMFIFILFLLTRYNPTHESCKDSVCYEHSLKLKNCRKGKEKYNNNNNKWESV